ncbi:hypothetical protein VP01_545g3 [Puccinia sorghi]|uniref:Uncharacterized protein n=1 Tax=Puccinia sorghi TaxID=27349 RepID=A0A0L6UJJ8_9BASI|nr:hypothetical protein VP01_545g3 [Puccinia sorghi]
MRGSNWIYEHCFLLDRLAVPKDDRNDESDFEDLLRLGKGLSLCFEVYHTCSCDRCKFSIFNWFHLSIDGTCCQDPFFLQIHKNSQRLLFLIDFRVFLLSCRFPLLVNYFEVKDKIMFFLNIEKFYVWENIINEDEFQCIGITNILGQIIGTEKNIWHLMHQHSVANLLARQSHSIGGSKEILCLSTCRGISILKIPVTQHRKAIRIFDVKNNFIKLNSFFNYILLKLFSISQLKLNENAILVLLTFKIELSENLYPSEQNQKESSDHHRTSRTLTDKKSYSPLFISPFPFFSLLWGLFLNQPLLLTVSHLLLSSLLTESSFTQANILLRHCLKLNSLGHKPKKFGPGLQRIKFLPEETLLRHTVESIHFIYFLLQIRKKNPEILTCCHSRFTSSNHQFLVPLSLMVHSRIRKVEFHLFEKCNMRDFEVGGGFLIQHINIQFKSLWLIEKTQNFELKNRIHRHNKPYFTIKFINLKGVVKSFQRVLRGQNWIWLNSQGGVWGLGSRSLRINVLR